MMAHHVQRRFQISYHCYSLFVIFIWTFTLISSTVAQEDLDPCDDENAILIPELKTCLVYIKQAKNWIEASRVCERDGGSLYQLQNGRLLMEDDVRNCIGAHPDAVPENDDFWIGATSDWTSQWIWVNGSFLNPLLTCSPNTTGMSPKAYNICSSYLSVDYCVSNCRSDGAPYCVLQYEDSTPCCWCSFREPSFPKTCPAKYLRSDPDRTFWVFHTYSDKGSGIILDSAESLTATETLCGVIDEKTTVRRELSSEPCFTKNPYICDFGSKYEECTFYLNDACMWIGPERLNWIEARAECQLRGGNLVVTVKDVGIVDQFKPYVKGSHWIGATNHLWNFEPLSNVFGTRPDYKRVSCAHLYHERGTWDWSDGSCDTRKPFVCKYNPKKEIDSFASFKCPWPIIKSTNAGILPNETGATLQTTSSSGTSAFPLAAIIAASIMALLIITCAILTIGFSRRRKRFVQNMTKSVRADGLFAISKSPKRYFHLWNSSFSYPPHYSDRKSDIDVDSLSTIHTGVFNDGSILSVPGYSYDEQGRPIYAVMGDADGLYGKINRRTESERSNVVHVLSDPIAEEEENDETNVKHLSSMSAIHSTDSHNAKEYMTLAAMMNFGDENILGKSTLRNRPEVALVTSDVDLNFTVNHAMPKRRTFSDTTERTIEEIELPRGTTVELPTMRKPQQEVDLHY